MGEKIVAEAKAPQDVQAPEADETAGPPPGLKEMLGLDLGPLDAAARKQFAIGEGAKGVVITEVTPGSDAERQGLITGLVISEVNQRKVASVDEVTSMVDAAKEAGRPAVLFKVTDPTGSSRFIAVKLAG